MSPRAVLYARVSTADKGQDWHAQIEELERVAEQRGWTVVGHYHDETSGADAERPGLAAAVARVQRGGVDIFAAVATDRFARSVRNLLELADQIEACGAKVSCTREGAMDTTTPQGKAFLQTRAVFAELERSLASERVREGLAVRRARGVILGRPRQLDYAQLQAAQQLRRDGRSWAEVAAALGGSGGAWSRALSRAGV